MISSAYVKPCARCKEKPRHVSSTGKTDTYCRECRYFHTRKKVKTLNPTDEDLSVMADKYRPKGAA